MKIKVLLLLLSLTLAPISHAQKLKGNKNVVMDHRELDEFNSIIIKSNIDVFLEESPTSKVRVETDENLQSAVETRVIGEVLEVYLSQDIRSKKKLNIYIGVTDLLQKIEVQDNASVIGNEDIHANAIELITEDNSSLEMKVISSDIIVIGKDKSDMNLTLKIDNTISVELSENANISMQCSSYKVDAKLSDNATFRPIGNCKELIINAHASSNVKAKDLLTEYAAIEATDRTNIFVNVAKELIISSEKMSEIFVFDNPKIFIEKFTDRSSLYKK